MGSARAGGGEPDHLLRVPHPRQALNTLGAAAAAFSLWRPLGLGYTYVTCLFWSRKSEAQRPPPARRDALRRRGAAGRALPRHARGRRSHAGRDD
jgi:hypothetical protein